MPLSSRQLPLLLAVAATLLVALWAPSSASAGREIPVGLWGVENNPIRTGQDQLAIRFVLDEPTTMHRFISGFNLEGVYTDSANRPAPADMRTAYRDKRRAPRSDGGDSRWEAPPADLPADWTPGSGRIGYAHGDGGVIWARLVRVKPTGEPDLSQVLGQERVNAVDRYRDSKAAFGAPGRNQLMYFNVGPVRLEANTMYAVVFTNVHSDPVHNYFSTNLPAANQQAAGPNGTNTLDPNAPGAVAGLDPRESVSWSNDGGQSWVWGWRVGGGDFFGYYSASPSGNGGPRMPWYGWQTSPNAPPQSNQPYFAYADTGSYTLVAHDAPRQVTLTEAGGYAPTGDQVGVVTVKNLATGETARTQPLGGGMARGKLDHPITIAAGQDYSISNSGVVNKAEADSFVRSTFNVGEGEWRFETLGHGEDRAELFALPHPWFAPQARAAQRPAGATTVRMRASRIHRARNFKRTRRAKVRIRGWLAPAARERAGGRVRIQMLRAGGWRRVGTARVRANGTVRSLERFRIPRHRRAVTLRAVAAADAKSRPVRMRVR